MEPIIKTSSTIIIGIGHHAKYFCKNLKFIFYIFLDHFNVLILKIIFF